MRRLPELTLAFILVAGAGVARDSGQDAQQAPAQPESATPVPPADAKAANAAQAGPRAQLLGRWKLNEGESENAREKVREAMERSRGRRRGGGGWGGGMGGGGGRRGGWGGGRGSGGSRGGQDPGRASDPREARSGFFEAPAEIEVIQLEPEIILTGLEGQIRTLHPDGKKYKVNDATDSQVKTRWDGVRLVVETTSGRSGKLTESWSADPEKRRLRVQLKMERPRGGEPVTVQRIYDALEMAVPPG